MERVQKEQSSCDAASASYVAQGKSVGLPTQTDMVARIHNSPLMAAHRKQLQGMFGDRVQLQTEEEEPLQGAFWAAQRVEEEELLQSRFAPESTVQREPEPAKPNNTGLPDDLKTGVESLSGMSLDHVSVHYNSSQPAQLNALAYAQGNDIHVAPGQERHLPHEAWHMVQQAQGRVQPTRQMRGGVPVNDDAGLEHEADVMGGRALQTKLSPEPVTSVQAGVSQVKSFDSVKCVSLTPFMPSDDARSSSTASELNPNKQFIELVIKALFRALAAIEKKDPKRSALLNQIGWSLVFKNYTDESVSKISEMWTVRLNCFEEGHSEKAINNLHDSILKLTMPELINIQKSLFLVDQPSKESPLCERVNTDNQLKKDKEVLMEKALSQLKTENISELEKIQEYWDAITSSNSQQIISYVLSKISGKLLNKLPKTGKLLDKLTKLWVLRNFGTLFLDILNIKDGDARSSRRLMFMDTAQTIELYGFLISLKHGDKNKRKINVVMRGDEVAFHQLDNSSVQPASTDLILGLTLSKFAALYLTDREQAFLIADIVGSYVWKYAPRMGTAAGKEEMRRINETLKLFKDGLNAASDIYQLFNPFWDFIQTTIAIGDLFSGNL